MPIPSNKKIHIVYINTINDDSQCRDEAFETILYRLKNNIHSYHNVATITLNIPADGPIPQFNIQVTKESAGRGLPGHSERRALALAINKAIEAKVKGFVALPPINNTIAPEPEEFDKYKEALKNLTEIKFYSERIPCARDYGRYESCDKFFSHLLEGSNYSFYYSIQLNQGSTMNIDLEQQVNGVKLYLKTHVDELTKKIDTQKESLSTSIKCSINWDDGVYNENNPIHLDQLRKLNSMKQINCAKILILSQHTKFLSSLAQPIIPLYAEPIVRSNMPNDSSSSNSSIVSPDLAKKFNETTTAIEVVLESDMIPATQPTIATTDQTQLLQTAPPDLHHSSDEEPPNKIAKPNL